MGWSVRNVSCGTGRVVQGRDREALARVTPPDCYKTQLRYSRPGPGDNVQIPGFGKWHVANCYYFRLWVDNHGKTRAERVQVFAAKLHRLGADGKFVEDKHFLPLNLRWSHSEDHPEVFAEGISPYMGKHCDLGRIIDPESVRTLQILKALPKKSAFLSWRSSSRLPRGVIFSSPVCTASN